LWWPCGKKLYSNRLTNGNFCNISVPVYHGMNTFYC
jgi:hypothetical protein